MPRRGKAANRKLERVLVAGGALPVAKLRQVFLVPVFQGLVVQDGPIMPSGPPLQRSHESPTAQFLSRQTTVESATPPVSKQWCWFLAPSQAPCIPRARVTARRWMWRWAVGAKGRARGRQKAQNDLSVMACSRE